jgi:hypothetical protein
MANVSPGPGRSSRPAENDVYTVLLCVSLLFLLLATTYVVYRAVRLFGGLLPPGGA